MNEFIWPIRVYYEDTDCGGIVYHSNYLKFMERSRTEWFRSVGVELDELAAEYAIQFAIHSLSINYLKPALFNDLLQIQTNVLKLNKASIVFEQIVLRQDDPSEPPVRLAEANIKVVALMHNKPAAMPKVIYDCVAHEIQ